MKYKCEVCGKDVVKAYEWGIKILCDVLEDDDIGDKHICNRIKIKRKVKRK